jgi:hypothetical protein
MWTTLVDSLAGKIAVCPDTKPARRWPFNPNGNPEALAKGRRMGQERKIILLQTLRDIVKNQGPISTQQIAKIVECHDTYILKLLKTEIQDVTYESVKNKYSKVFMWSMK